MTRLQAKLKQEELKLKDIVRLTGIKYKTVSRQCITGIKTPRVAKKYAAALNCNPLDLLEL